MRRALNILALLLYALTLPLAIWLDPSDAWEMAWMILGVVVVLVAAAVLVVVAEYYDPRARQERISDRYRSVVLHDRLLDQRRCDNRRRHAQYAERAMR